MADRKYLIGGESHLSGTDDVFDFLASYGVVTLQPTGRDRLATLTLTPSSYATSTTALIVYLYDGSDPTTEFDRGLLGSASVMSAVPGIPFSNFADLADAVAYYLCGIQIMPLEASSVACEAR